MASRIFTRSAERPRRRARDPKVVALYWQVWEGLPCEYGLLRGERCPGNELNHILSGQRKEDAFWNFIVMCRRHHRDEVEGFHGPRNAEMRAEILQAKLDQGFILPREAYAFLPCGIDAAPDIEVDEKHNYNVALARAMDLRRSGWEM